MLSISNHYIRKSIAPGILHEKCVPPNCFRDGNRTSVPAARKLRVTVLQYGLEQFDTQREYPESEVNDPRKDFLEDFTPTRRDGLD